MNSTNNNSFEIAAKKVFSDLYVLIKEDEKETEYKIDNKNTDDKNEIDNKMQYQLNLIFGIHLKVIID